MKRTAAVKGAMPPRRAIAEPRPACAGMGSGGHVGAALRVATLSSSNTILTALIQGRSVSKTLVTPSSLLDVFRFPRHYRDQSLAGFFCEVAVELDKGIAQHLQSRPLSTTEMLKLNAQVINLNRKGNKKEISKAVIGHGIDLLKSLGYDFEIDGLSVPRIFWLEVISLAEVGRKLGDWVLKNGNTVDQKKRLGAIAQFQIVVDMFMEKQREWNDLRVKNGTWYDPGKYVTAEDIKWRAFEITWSGIKNVKLFGRKEDRDFRGVRMVSFGFEGVDLSGADFSEARLPGCRFIKVNLTRADFSGATIRAEFKSTDLSGANFQGAHIGMAEFSESVLANADFRGAKLEYTHFRLSNLQGAQFERATFGCWSRFEGADLRGANLAYTSFERSIIAASNFSNAVLRGADLRGQNLYKVRLNGADLTEVKMDAQTRWDEAEIDTKALETLSAGPFRGLSMKKKKELWKKRGGKIVGEET